MINEYAHKWIFALENFMRIYFIFTQKSLKLPFAYRHFRQINIQMDRTYLWEHSYLLKYKDFKINLGLSNRKIMDSYLKVLSILIGYVLELLAFSYPLKNDEQIPLINLLLTEINFDIQDSF